MESAAPSLASTLSRPGGVSPAPRAARWRGKAVGDVVFRYAGVLLLLLIWAGGSATSLIPEEALPSPWAVLEAGRSLIKDGQLVEAIFEPLRRVTIGLTLGVSAGAVLAIISRPESLGRKSHRQSHADVADLAAARRLALAVRQERERGQPQRHNSADP